MSRVVPEDVVAGQRFSREDDRARFEALRGHFLEAAQGWAYSGARRSGHFLEERWEHDPARPAEGRVPDHRLPTTPGSRWYRLATVGHGAGGPGLSFDAACIPEGDAWGASLSLAIRGGTVLGSTLYLELVQYRGGQEVARVEVLPWTYLLPHPFRVGSVLRGTYQAGFRQLQQPRPDPGEALDDSLVAEARAALVSADALREVGRARLAELERWAAGQIWRGEVSRGVTGPYLGGGLPPQETGLPVGPLGLLRLRAGLWWELRGARRRLEEGAAPGFAALRSLGDFADLLQGA